MNELQKLHQLIRDQWESFVDQAPDDWLEDGWLKEREPVGIICKFGQNQPLSTSGGAFEDEMENWDKSRDFTHAKWLSFATATHYEYGLSLTFQR